MSKCVVLFNSKSGNYNRFLSYKDKIGKIISTQYKPVFKDLSKLTDEQIKAILNNKSNTLVIVAGGDGSFNFLATHVIKNKSNIKTSYIPFGTTNDMAKNLYLPSNNPIKAIKKILEGMEYPINICSMNDKHFAYIAAMGTIPSVSYSTPSSDKQKVKYLAYIKQLYRTIKEDGLEEYNVEYEIDGKKYEESCNVILVSNGKGLAGLKEIFKDSKFNDDVFELTLIKIKDIKQRFNVLTNFFVRKMPLSKISEVNYHKTSNLKLTIKNKPLYNWTRDGEETKMPTENIEFKIAGNMNVVLPKDSIKKLTETK